MSPPQDGCASTAATLRESGAPTTLPTPALAQSQSRTDKMHAVPVLADVSASGPVTEALYRAVEFPLAFVVLLLALPVMLMPAVPARIFAAATLAAVTPPRCERSPKYAEAVTEDLTSIPPALVSVMLDVSV